MALQAPTFTPSNRTPQTALEPGTYPARVVRVIDEGLQPQTDFTTKEPKKPAQIIRVTYELVDAFMVDDDGNELEDKPRWLSENFPLHAITSDLAKSTKRINAIDPKGTLKGDWSQVIGIPCSVVVGNYTSKEVLRDKVLNVTAIRARDAATLPELKNEGKFFDLSNPDLEFFTSLPKWQQDIIKGNLEFAGSPLDRALGGKPAPSKKEQEQKVEEATEAEASAEDGEDIPW